MLCGRYDANGTKLIGAIFTIVIMLMTQKKNYCDKNTYNKIKGNIDNTSSYNDWYEYI